MHESYINRSGLPHPPLNTTENALNSYQGNANGNSYGSPSQPAQKNQQKTSFHSFKESLAKQSTLQDEPTSEYTRKGKRNKTFDAQMFSRGYNEPQQPSNPSFIPKHLQKDNFTLKELLKSDSLNSPRNQRKDESSLSKHGQKSKVSKVVRACNWEKYKVRFMDNFQQITYDIKNDHFKGIDALKSSMILKNDKIKLMNFLKNLRSHWTIKLVQFRICLFTLILIGACAISYISWHTSLVILSILFFSYFMKRTIYNQLYMRYCKYLQRLQNQVNRGDAKHRRMDLLRVYLNMDTFYKNLRMQGQTSPKAQKVNVTGSLSDLVIGINICRLSFKEGSKKTARSRIKRAGDNVMTINRTLKRAFLTEKQPAGPPSDRRETERGLVLETNPDQQNDEENNKPQYQSIYPILVMPGRKQDFDRKIKRATRLNSLRKMHASLNYSERVSSMSSSNLKPKGLIHGRIVQFIKKAPTVYIYKKSVQEYSMQKLPPQVLNVIDKPIRSQSKRKTSSTSIEYGGVNSTNINNAKQKNKNDGNPLSLNSNSPSKRSQHEDKTSSKTPSKKKNTRRGSNKPKKKKSSRGASAPSLSIKNKLSNKNMESEDKSPSTVVGEKILSCSPLLQKKIIIKEEVEAMKFRDEDNYDSWQSISRLEAVSSLGKLESGSQTHKKKTKKILEKNIINMRNHKSPSSNDKNVFNRQLQRIKQSSSLGKDQQRRVNSFGKQMSAFSQVKLTPDAHAEDSNALLNECSHPENSNKSNQFPKEEISEFKPKLSPTKDSELSLKQEVSESPSKNYHSQSSSASESLDDTDQHSKEIQWMINSKKRAFLKARTPKVNGSSGLDKDVEVQRLKKKFAKRFSIQYSNSQQLLKTKIAHLSPLKIGTDQALSSVIQKNLQAIQEDNPMNEHSDSNEENIESDNSEDAKIKQKSINFKKLKQNEPDESRVPSESKEQQSSFDSVDYESDDASQNASKSQTAGQGSALSQLDSNLNLKDIAYSVRSHLMSMTQEKEKQSQQNATTKSPDRLNNSKSGHKTPKNNNSSISQNNKDSQSCEPVSEQSVNFSSLNSNELGSRNQIRESILFSKHHGNTEMSVKEMESVLFNSNFNINSIHENKLKKRLPSKGHNIITTSKITNKLSKEVKMN